MLVSFAFLFALYGNNLCTSQPDLPEVDTPLGKVQGFWNVSLDGRKYAAFEGLPYAKPPVGDLRFEEPQPITPWSGVWKADTPHTCLQVGVLYSPDPLGDEDCLYLNIYVPADLLNTTKQLEVVVVIHGGVFLIGSGHGLARSDFFMDRDIVLVTNNYRLGLLGFLSTEDGAVPGNNGLKDQVLALEWVRDNIASFGGNPHSVTLVGLSAGGASVHYHYFSPLSKDLFHRGMSQSGTVLAPWVISRRPLQNAKRLAASVGCPDESTEELKRCLKQRPARDLVKQTKISYGYDIFPLAPYAPVVEKGSEKPFLDKQPFRLLSEGKVLDVPWITSSAADDGLLPSAFLWDDLDAIAEKWTQISPFLLECNDSLPESKRKTLPGKVLDFYLGPGKPINKENFKNFTQMFTDRHFGIPAEIAAKMQAKATKSPVYYYLFSYKDGANKGVEVLSTSPGIEGVSHGEDSIYFQGYGAEKPFSEKDKRLRNAFHRMLYEFASTGIPSFDGTDNWQPTGPTELTYLNVAGPEEMKLQTVRNLTPSAFWDGLGLLENGNIAVKDEL